MKQDKDKQIRELNNIIIFLIIIFILAGIFMMFFMVMWINTSLEPQSCQEKVSGLTENYLGDCLVYPQGILFNVTKGECEEHTEIHERMYWVLFCIEEDCEELK